MSTIKTITVLLLILLALGGAAAPAEAGQLSLVLNGKSIHVGSEYSWNEDNRGFGLEYELDRNSRWIRSAVVSGFRDSMDNMSYMAGFGLKRRLFETERLAGLHFDAGLVGFLMSREDANDNLPFPGVLPVVTLGNRHLGLNLTYVPEMVVEDITRAKKVDPNIKGVFFLQAKFTIGGNSRR